MDALCEAAGETTGKATGETAAGKTLIVVSHDPRTREHFDAPRDFLSLLAA
jgi:hypothetical protein